MNLNVSDRSVVLVNPECQCYALFFILFLFFCLFVCCSWLLVVVSGVCFLFVLFLFALMKILPHASSNGKTKRIKGFKFRAFIGRFQVT